jgi:hypothetical protein
MYVDDNECRSTSNLFKDMEYSSNLSYYSNVMEDCPWSGPLGDGDEDRLLMTDGNY